MRIIQFYLLLVAAVFSLKDIHASAGTFQLVNKTVISWNDTSRMQFLHDPTVYSEGWDTLAHSKFWKEIMCLSSDTFVLNIAYCRKPIEKMHRATWMNLTEDQKLVYKDSLSFVHCIDSSKMIYVTGGKGEFYEVKKVLPEIGRAIRIFEDNNCDPWYAQTILLIESPGKNRNKSSAGALGPFQLMPAVARKYGLIVNKTIDQRTDLDKSAKAASRLINGACVPGIKNILNEKGIQYRESDLWFRLLVLHAYHAGVGNVRCVLNTLNPTEGGIGLFMNIWQTTCGSFKNESQNYSQIALGAITRMEELIGESGDTVFLVTGDRMLREYSKKNQKTFDTYNFLTTCLKKYETDFIDGMIPFEYFMKRVGFIRKELTELASVISNSEKEIVLKKYPAEESHVNYLAAQLTKRQRYQDAISMLKINLDMHPDSPAVYDSLARAYRLSGDRKTAELYMKRSSGMSRHNNSQTDIR
ncbi:MAG: hypothetical protein DWQ44_11835 [Bacteroidetes bacterium]|nr:MAG: hypothetical protein DWQ33_10795 [Bacteroidota bacterium]REK05310.1 MAG: hypothetical protein DWQ39_08960 [Bacteroidota bacterium]REK32716.1 MAG: hypothetical protein DWQ44_11835 [Bacteroidota bacterium]REK48838.1 MAG: hypothetical protein DWQ48_08130 [Bacteroidota bacterium]